MMRPFKPLRASIAFSFALGLCSIPFGDAAELPHFSPPGTILVRGHFTEAGGEEIFQSVCRGCHMPHGEGAVGAGHYPKLARNPRLASAVYPVLVVLNGRHGMPPFGDSFDDAQVAGVVNYLRSHFGNQYGDVLSAADVERLRRQSAGSGESK